MKSQSQMQSIMVKTVRDYINTGKVEVNRVGKVCFTFLMYLHRAI